jgi:hypothetical protein
MFLVSLMVVNNVDVFLFALVGIVYWGIHKGYAGILRALRD